MTGQTLLINITIGLLLGLAGQVLRAVAGLKKNAGMAATSKDPTGTPFSWSQFGVSLIVGACAGMFGAISMWDRMTLQLNRDVVLGLIAAGYSGADFLEGVVNWLPKKGA